MSLPLHWVAAVIFLAIVTLPYLLALRAGGEEFVFGGFLFNPLDGNTYLAKMYQGWLGEWRFTLPYTAEPGKGAYLFLFYLFLGHLARLFALPLGITFHLARILGAGLLLHALWRFFTFTLTTGRTREYAYVLAVLGSGMGWLAAPFGVVTSDLWVAEAYPFLSAYATPHFAIGLALVLYLITEPFPPRHPSFSGQGVEKAKFTPPFLLGEDGAQRGWWDWIGLLLGSFLLAILSPFGIVIALVVVGIRNLVIAAYRGVEEGWKKKFRLFIKISMVRLLPLIIGGVPVLLYDQWVAVTDPVLAGWNAQNVTSSPPVWDVALSLSPVLIVAAAGAWRAVRLRDRYPLNLVIWVVASLLLLYAPFDLQRRLMMGLFVPLAGLAAYGLQYLPENLSGRSFPIVVFLWLLSLPSLLLVLMVGWRGAQTHEPLLYMTRGEVQAMDWIEANLPQDALVLASPETGLFLPAHTGRRVLYGHPFETVDAKAEEAAITDFYLDIGAAGGTKTASRWLKERQIDYLWIGPRERKLMGLAQMDAGEFTFSQLRQVFRGEDVTIYEVER